MSAIAACEFGEPAKTYYLNTGALPVGAGSRIVATTARGLEIGRVKYPPREPVEGEDLARFKSIKRLATPEDEERAAAHRAEEQQILNLARERIASFSLKMKPVKAEIMLDRARLFLYYESEERVDFRELLRVLSSRLRMRLQLQQVGAREAAKVLGGVGPCGLSLCCATFLTSMPPVTLKMAKEQNLALTPNKISGACGRLMCCLRYEVEFYRDQHARLPRPGNPVDSPEGPGQVTAVDIFNEKCEVQLGDGRRIWVGGDELRALREARGMAQPCRNSTSGGCSSGGCSSGGCSSGGCTKTSRVGEKNGCGSCGSGKPE